MSFDDFSFAFNNKVYSDYTLKIQAPERDEEIIHVTKALLAKHSSYFKAQFESKMMESKKKNETVIILDESSQVPLFVEIIKYLYIKKITTTNILEIIEILTLANRFLLSNVCVECTKMISSIELNPATAITLVNVPEAVQQESPNIFKKH